MEFASKKKEQKFIYKFIYSFYIYSYDFLCIPFSWTGRTESVPLMLTTLHGWSNRKSRKLLHSGSSPGSLHKHVGRKNGKACNVFNAAKHLVTVTVLQATAIRWKSNVYDFRVSEIRASWSPSAKIVYRRMHSYNACGNSHSPGTGPHTRGITSSIDEQDGSS